MADNNNDDDLRHRMEAHEQISRASKRPWKTFNRY